jgi:hypothetical protein
MKFTVNVAADIYGRKENLRFHFDSCPTISKLTNTTESEFDIAARGSRPVGYPDTPFRVLSFQLYDTAFNRWVDLYSDRQLTSGCQVYAFQPESVWNPYYRGPIPAAKDTVTWESTASSPRRLPSERGMPPSTLEKIRAVFSELDKGNKGYVLYADLRAALERNGIEFTYETVGGLFNKVDTDRDGRINYAEWMPYALDHMNLVDAIFFREMDASNTRTQSMRSRSASTERSGSVSRQREADLDRKYRETHEKRLESEKQFETARRELEAAKSRFDRSVTEEGEARRRLLSEPMSRLA